MENINYTPKDILQKEFKQKMRGYDPNDVDSFWMTSSRIMKPSIRNSNPSVMKMNG